MVKRREIICEYQNYIDNPPVARQSLYGQAASNDGPTVNAWRETWIRNTRKNHERFGPFRERGVGKLWGKYRNQPAIVVGSGPSLKENAGELAKNPGILTISCLHNFHFLEDLGVKVDYYVSLDAGPVTIEELTEGGTGIEEDYWRLTKDRTLIAYIGSDPKLLERWQGDIYFFSCPIPDHEIMKTIDEIEPFRTDISSGGNVLGACVYVAKAFFGCNPIIFMGADFSFSYLDKFHGWDSKYDANLGHYVRLTDVYGNSVKSWQSYANFKAFFDWLAETVPGIYINCTEGGTLGAYNTGNIRSIKQMTLAECFQMYSVCENVKEQCLYPETAQRKILY